MRRTYLLIFLSLSVFAQNKPRIEVIPNPESLEDFDHEFKGCPENSDCDQVMGLMMTNWKTLIKNLKGMTEPQKVTQALELFRSKYGLPSEVYALQKTQKTFKPALYSSPCKEHNPKTGDKIYKGLLFVKGMTTDVATIWRDQAQHEIQLKENMDPQPIRVYFDGAPVTVMAPLNDQPLFIKNRELYFLKEEDGLYYALKISEKGAWGVANIDMTQLSALEEKRGVTTCPADGFKPNAVFADTFCKTIWDLDQKKTVVVKLAQGCAI